MPPRKAKPTEAPAGAAAGRPVVDGVQLAHLPPLGEQMAAPPTTELEARLERELEEVLGELGSGTAVKVARVNPDTGTRAHVGTLSGEGFNMDLLADTFGGGRYYLRVAAGKEEKWRGYVEVDPAIPPKNPRAKGAPTAAGASSGGGQFLEQMATVMATMTQMQMGSMQMMQSMIASQQQGTAAMIQAMTAAMTASKGESPLDLVRAVVEMTKGNGDGGGAVEALKMLREGITLGKEVAGGGDEKEGWLGIVREGVSGVAQVLQNRPAAAPAATPNPAPVPVALPAPVPTPAPAPMPATAATPNGAGDTTVLTGQFGRLWVREARPHVATLRQAALLQLSAESVGEMVVKGASEPMWDDLCAFHDEAPTTFVERALAELPELKEFGQWGQDVLEEVRQQIVATAEEGDADGDASDGGSDAP